MLGGPMRHIETIDAELRLVPTLRRAARERGGPLPSIGVADALLDERPRAGQVSQLLYSPDICYLSVTGRGTALV
jgi:hypothetical protein